MKQFLALYLGSANQGAWQDLDEKTRGERIQAGGRAWTEWMERHGDKVVVHGGPCGKTKKADAQGISDTKNAVTGYVVVQAESHQEAAQLFADHPHFSIFPGDCVEIMECLPIPKF